MSEPKSPGYLRIGGAALNQTPFDWQHNTNNIIQSIQQAQDQFIDILCLPELCITGYGCEDTFLSQWLAEEALEQLFLILPHTQNITVCVGLPIWFEQQLYNAACLIDNGKILGFTCKQFLANDGVHYEPRWFTPWPREVQKVITIKTNNYPIGEVLYDVKGIKIGFEICEDAWRPERPGIRHCEKGVDLILNPSASHFAFEKSHIRYDLVIGGSKRFDCAYIYADLLGNEAGRMIYDGEVLIAYKGELLQRNDRLSFRDIEIIYKDINFKTSENKSTPLQTDTIDRTHEFWEAVTLGLFDYMRKSRSTGFVLSLSGGADSSACAVMVSEMIKKGVHELGIENFIQKAGIKHLIDNNIIELPIEEAIKKLTSLLLICAYQGTKNSGVATLESARELAHSIGATFYHWTVDDEVNSYITTCEKVLGRKLTWETDDIALQNIQARSRAPIIWMLANIKNALLITTSNRSEGDVGYATMDGDTAGSIAPIAGVDKHFVREWLLWAEKHKKQSGLRYVNALTPTAELRPSDQTQTDEKDLMPYSLMVEIERLAIRDRKSPLEAFVVLKNKLDYQPEILKAYIIKFYRLWSRNQWKRERIAPSFHLDEFNVDPRSWCRFPILSGGFKTEIEKLENYN